MKTSKKIICGILSAVLLMSVIAGCGKKDESVGNVADNKWKASDGVEIDWFINMSFWDAASELWCILPSM